MSKTKVLRRNPNMVTREIDDETILLPIYKKSDELDCIYTLNKSASRIWEFIDGKMTLDEIKNKVLKEFDVTPEKIDKKLQKLIKELKEIKAVK